MCICAAASWRRGASELLSELAAHSAARCPAWCFTSQLHGVSHQQLFEAVGARDFARDSHLRGCHRLLGLLRHRWLGRLDHRGRNGSRSRLRVGAGAPACVIRGLRGSRFLLCLDRFLHRFLSSLYWRALQLKGKCVDLKAACRQVSVSDKSLDFSYGRLLQPQASQI